jgi:hypothetical protein
LYVIVSLLVGEKRIRTNAPVPALGGFKISFFTDSIQGVMVLGLIFIATITIGVKTNIDTSLIESSGLTKASLLGWQLVYILPVAILTNDFFLVSHLPQRTLVHNSPNPLPSLTSGSAPSPPKPTRTSGSASRARPSAC